MLKKVLLLPIAVIAFSIFASPITLVPLEDGSFDETKTTNVTGRCGEAIVRVMGITNSIESSFGVEQDIGRVIVRNAGKELVLTTEDDALSDHNGVGCVATPNGDRLLIWSNCGGSICSEEYNFFIINPVDIKVLAPTPDQKGLCDENCASAILGNRVPQNINGRL